MFWFRSSNKASKINALDNIIAKLKDGQIDLNEAVGLTMKVENVNMLGIDENNVEEALTQ